MPIRNLGALYETHWRRLLDIARAASQDRFAGAAFGNECPDLGFLGLEAQKQVFPLKMQQLQARSFRLGFGILRASFQGGDGRVRGNRIMPRFVKFISKPRQCRSDAISQPLDELDGTGLVAKQATNGNLRQLPVRIDETNGFFALDDRILVYPATSGSQALDHSASRFIAHRRRQYP